MSLLQRKFIKKLSYEVFGRCIKTAEFLDENEFFLVDGVDGILSLNLMSYKIIDAHIKHIREPDDRLDIGLVLGCLIFLYGFPGYTDQVGQLLLCIST